MKKIKKDGDGIEIINEDSNKEISIKKVKLGSKGSACSIHKSEMEIALRRMQHGKFIRAK